MSKREPSGRSPRRDRGRAQARDRLQPGPESDPPRGRFQARINPLAFPEVDFSSAGEPDSISAETILSFLCQPETPVDAESLVERYKRISTEPTLLVAPAEPRILEKLVWPLRHAKASYVVGNNLSAVALCGMVAEMVAVLLWQLAETQLNAQTMTENDEVALYGSFEKLGQAHRVKILKKYGIIEPDRATDFDTIRETRRRYLHLWSHDHGRLQEDAEKCFHAATRLVREAIGPYDFEDGKIMLHPKLVEYLAQEGVFEPHQDSAGVTQ